MMGYQDERRQPEAGCPPVGSRLSREVRFIASMSRSMYQLTVLALPIASVPPTSVTATSRSEGAGVPVVCPGSAEPCLVSGDWDALDRLLVKSGDPAASPPGLRAVVRLPAPPANDPTVIQPADHAIDRPASRQFAMAS